MVTVTVTVGHIDGVIIDVILSIDDVIILEDDIGDDVIRLADWLIPFDDDIIVEILETVGSIDDCIDIEDVELTIEDAGCTED